MGDAVEVVRFVRFEGDEEVRAGKANAPVMVAGEEAELDGRRRVTRHEREPRQVREANDNGPVLFEKKDGPVLEPGRPGKRYGAVGAAIGGEADPAAARIFAREQEVFDPALVREAVERRLHVGVVGAAENGVQLDGLLQTRAPSFGPRREQGGRTGLSS